MAQSETKTILLVDDDSELCALMAEYFTLHGFHMSAAHDGRQGLARALEGAYDLIILDVMLPVLDGFEVLRQLRRRSSTPVIMLTARIGREDRVAGLDAGADDYLPKPFGPDELLARIRAVLRRTVPGGGAAAKPTALEIGELTVNPHTREVWRAGELVELTSIEFDILDFLARSAGRVVSRDELTAAIHQRPATPYERSLDVHISHLRKKLEQGDRELIRTIRGVGYFYAPAPEAND